MKSIVLTATISKQKSTYHSSKKEDEMGSYIAADDHKIILKSESFSECKLILKAGDRVQTIHLLFLVCFVGKQLQAIK